MTTEYASQVHPLAPKNNQTNAYFFLWAGTNDLYYDSNSSTILSCLEIEWAMARADGFKVVAVTITNRSGVYILNGTQESNRTALNGGIIAASSQYDYLIRADLILPDPTNTTYFVDGLHPTPAGSYLIASNFVNNFYSNPYNELNNWEGNLGIGTTTPPTALTIVAPESSTNGILKLQVQNGQPFDFAGISFFAKSQSPTAGSLNWMISTNYNQYGELNFLRSTSSSTNPTISTLDLMSSGNVGVNTTAPISTLEVNGNATIDQLMNLSVMNIPHVELRLMEA